MTLTNLINTLPNGFHDAIMKSVMLDYQKHEARIEFMIWVGDLEAKDEEIREAHEEADLILKGLSAWIIEPPDSYYKPSENGNSMIDMGSFDSLPDEPPIEVPNGSFGN